MSHSRSVRSVSALLALVLCVSFAAVAYPTRTAEAYEVDSCGYDCQNIGQRVEEYDWETNFDYGNCYGACGPGCTATCGGGGACQVHDYYMRKHGLWSWQQFATFPAALVQWGACVTWRAIENIGQTIVSKVTSAAKWIWNKVSGIFN